MAIGSTFQTGNVPGVGGSVSSLAQELFRRIDINNDGRLTTNEFQKFLEILLQRTGQGAEGGLVRAASAPTRVYEPMPGFDHRKLNTPTHATAKYVFARATQDIQLGLDRASRSAGLAQIVENVRQNGYSDAKVTGDDTIDFGDGFGEIDVLTSDGRWWWGPR